MIVMNYPNGICRLDNPRHVVRQKLYILSSLIRTRQEKPNFVLKKSSDSF